MLSTLTKIRIAAPRGSAFRSYYDSQSGKQITLNSQLRCYDETITTIDSSRPNHMMLENIKKCNFDGMRMSSKEDFLRLPPTYLPPDSPVIPSFDFNVTNEEKEESMTNVKSWINHPFIFPSLEKRVILNNSSSISPIRLQSIGGSLCDEGATIIVIELGKDQDADDLGEMVDALCEIDCLGIPIRNRLALRILNSSPESEQDRVEEIVEQSLTMMDILRFDTCFYGVTGVKPSTLYKVATSVGKDMNLRMDKVKVVEDDFRHQGE